MGPSHVARVERQLAVAQQITHIGSWEWDIAAGVIAWSDELYRIYGLEPRSTEITFDFFVSRLYPADRSRVERAIRAALESTKARFEWYERIVRPDGSMRDLHTIGEVDRDRDGRPKALIGTCRDITDERAQTDQIRFFTDIVNNVQIALSVWSVDKTRESPQACLLAYNPAAEIIARTPLAPFVGKTLRELAPYAAGGQLESLIEETARDRQVRQASVERSKDASNPTRALWIKTFPLPHGCVGVAIEDVTTHTLDRRLQTAEHRVLEMIASGMSLKESLEALIRAVEDYCPSIVGSILLLDADGVHLRHGAAPNLPAEFCREIDGSAIGPRAGSCGTAAFLKRPVFVGDVETDPLWEDYRDLARPHGLVACWSFPVFATDRRVLGTYAFYGRHARMPTPRDEEVMARAARLAGIAIERKQLEQQLRDLNAHVESAIEDERTGIAREIHDELGQSLTALKMDIAWLLRRTAAPNVMPPKEAVEEKLRAMSALTDEVIQQVRRISAELRPGVLDDLGLLAAIEWQAQQFEDRNETICRVRSNVADVSIDNRVSTAAFRIFQEALTNVSRHARAAHVDVHLEVLPDSLALEIRDDGIGISADAARSPKSLGLLGIRERAARLGGQVEVGSISPSGTFLSLKLPLAGARSGP